MKVSRKYEKYEEEYSKRLELIKEQYLLKHFEQMSAVLEKNYRYGFNLIKHISLIIPSKVQITIIRMNDIIQHIVSRKKKQVLLFLLRKTETNTYLKSKSCICLVSLLERKLVVLAVDVILRLKESRILHKQISKDKQCFLIIKLSNLNKLFSIKKSEGFYAIVNESIMVGRSTKLLRLIFTLSSMVNRRFIDAFQNVVSRGPTKTVYDKDSIKNQSDRDSQAIWIQSYKSMAHHLKSRQTGNSRSSQLSRIKQKIALTNIFGLLGCKLRQNVHWSFCDLLCLDNHRYKVSNLTLLQKEIAILQKQYQSV